MTKNLTLTLPIKPHVNQLAIIRPEKRFNVIAAGRRFGKTESQKLRAIYMVMEGFDVWWLNPTFDNTYDAWLDFLVFFEQFVPRENINKSRRQIFAPTGGSIRMLGADNFKRGSGIKHVYIDEAAFIDLNQLWEYQLRPMLLDTPGSGATFLSSTNGRNMFWQLYQRGLDPSEPDWYSWHFTSYDNPLLDPHEIEDIKRNTPERVFQQEYMAEFLEDGGAVFRNIMACVDTTIHINAEENIYPVKQGDIVIGMDLGRHNDSTRIYAMDTQTNQVVDYDGFTEVSWELQRVRLQAMAQRWQPSVIWIEENFNDSFVERLQTDGLPVRAYRTTAQSKQQLINALALAFEQHDIHIPHEKGLIAELQAYTIERLPGGTLRYTAPSGLHDDRVIALSLAWHGILNQPSFRIYRMA